MKIKLPRGSFVTRGRIPGVRGSEDSLISGRAVRSIAAEKARLRRRIGARTRAQIADEQELRAHGVNVFDRNAGLSELGGYLTPRE